MARAGLRRIGDLAMRPRAPISARFGAEALARLDALNGLARDVDLAALRRRPIFRAERRFASPIAHVDAVMATLAKLADDLVVLLERQMKGARALELSLYRVDGDVRRIRVGAGRPLNEARAIARLFAERLAGGAEGEIDAGFGIDLMRLSCLAAEPLAPSQREWERAHEAERAADLADLLDRLSARLGASRVTRQTLVDAHIPEQAVAAAPAIRGAMRARDEAPEPTPAPRRRAGRCGCSSGPSRSRRSPKFPTVRRSGSAGGACCTRSPRSRAPSASPRPGGGAPTRPRATISAPRTPRAAATGSTAKASTAARRRGRSGSCMGCSGDAPSPLAGEGQEGSARERLMTGSLGSE